MNYVFNLSNRLLASIASYQFYRSRTGVLAIVARRIALLRYLFWSVVTGSDIAPTARLGVRLRLPHPNGVVIHRNAIIGDDCMIMQQVTVGMVGDSGAPIIGSEVYCGSGAKVLGGIRIGDRVWIGANAVVLCDVPDDCTAVGIPARVIRRSIASEAGLT